MVCNKPIALPVIIPIAPYKLLIHPGIGSFDVDVTIEGRMMQVGISVLYCRTVSSATAFVNVYVLGQSPINLYLSQCNIENKNLGEIYI